MQKHIKNIENGATDQPETTKQDMESYGSNPPQAHSNGTLLVFPGCHMIKQTNIGGVVQRNSPHHQLCTHKLQNNKTKQSVLNSIIAVCEQHAKYLQPPKCANQDMWQKLFKSSTSLSKKIIQRSHTQKDLQALTWTKITDFRDLVKISDFHQLLML